MNSLKKEDLIFTDTDNGTSTTDKAVLGTLEGPCADFIDGTRNGRHYSEKLWDNVFNDPIITEMIDAGGIVGELDHPTDREETDSSRIAIIMREKPIKKNGKLWAKFDILNTPLGRIAHTLAKAGFKLGISSRGSGDVSPNLDGTEEVDESTYDFKAFDLVLLPAVKAARLNLVTEGLDSKAFNYKKVLLESIEAASDEDKKIMQETLSNLHINLNESEKPLNEDVVAVENAIDVLHDYLISWYDDNIAPEKAIDAEEAGWDDEVQDAWLLLTNLVTRLKNPDFESRDDRFEESEDMAVDDDKALFDELQEALKENKGLADTITSLQEKLSVSYAKEMELKENVDKYSNSIRKLSNDAKQVVSLKAKISSLNEELDSANKKISQQDEALKKFRENSMSLNATKKKLLEQCSETKQRSNQLQKRIELMESETSKKEQTLNESIADLQNTIELKNKEYSQKLSKANKLVENYKSIANKAVDKYIESQTRILGVTKEEVKNKLPESYTFDDIDNICENLREYKLNISRLPFNTTMLKENVQVKATPSKNETILPANNFADEVDEQLMSLAGLQ